LLGTVAGDQEIARAVIEDTATKIQDLYKIGDSIQAARIERIERSRVVLLREGREEVLEMSMADLSSSPGATPSAAAAGAPFPREAVTVISPTEFEINRRALLSRIGGIEAILRTTRVTPYVVDGNVEGLRLTGLANVSMARFVGLEDGDIIQNVNGQALTSLPKAFQVFQKARRQSFVDIELLRGDEKKRLRFDIR
jgi:general secretion pathway protein C